jgi:hypothetical protein
MSGLLLGLGFVSQFFSSLLYGVAAFSQKLPAGELPTHRALR